MVLKLVGVKKHFGGVKAVDGVSLELKKGKINALIGPNGSGKTTLFNSICKLFENQQGGIYIDGKSMEKFKDCEISKNWISRTFQENRNFKNLTIRDHLILSKTERDEEILWSLLKRDVNIDKELIEILQNVGLNKSLDTIGSDLSYGQKKLLSLAMALIKPHKLLMLDEPVAGVNPALRKEIKKVIQKIKNDNNETILIIEHDMNFIMDLADWVFVMDEGRLIAQGKPKEVQNNKRVLDAYLGG